MADNAAIIVIRETDNVGTVTRNVVAGESVSARVGNQTLSLVAASDIKFLHKIALKDIAARERIFKYGAVIGEATQRIQAGEHVHVHNIRSLWGKA